MKKQNILLKTLLDKLGYLPHLEYIAIPCRTKHEAALILPILFKMNVKWKDLEPYSDDKTGWSRYNENTVYFIRRSLTHKRYELQISNCNSIENLKRNNVKHVIIYPPAVLRPPLELLKL